MSIKVMNAVWESDVKDGRFVLLALADNANDGGYCKPGTAYLAGKVRQDRATVFRALRALEDDDVIQRRARTRENGSRTSNAYRINLELLRSRRRAVSADEVSELASLFDAEPETPGSGPSQDATGAENEPQEPIADPPSHFATGEPVADCDRGSRTVRPPEPTAEPQPKDAAAGSSLREDPLPTQTADQSESVVDLEGELGGESCPRARAEEEPRAHEATTQGSPPAVTAAATAGDPSARTAPDPAPDAQPRSRMAYRHLTPPARLARTRSVDLGSLRPPPAVASSPLWRPLVSSLRPGRVTITAPAAACPA